MIQYSLHIILFVLLIRPIDNLQLENGISPTTIGFAYNALKEEKTSTEINDEDQSTCDCKAINVSLNFSGMSLQSIDSYFINSSHVTDLHLEGNVITNINAHAFDGLPNLRTLNLARNKIDILKFLFLYNNPQNLVILILNENYLSTDPQNLGTPFLNEIFTANSHLKTLVIFPKLQRLYFRNVQIVDSYYNRHYYNENIYNYLFKKAKFPNLTHLDLSGKELSGNICANIPESVTHLRLEEAKLDHLDGSCFRNIVDLSLSNNNIAHVCNRIRYSPSLSLAKMDQLQYLSLSHNNITLILPDAFDDTINLLTLDLSYNRVEIIKETFRTLSSLQNLFLDHNQLETIPTLTGLYNLTKLSLSYNNISLVSFAFSPDFPLRSLSLSNNKISDVSPESFSDLTNLEELDLSYNLLSYLPPDFIQEKNYNLRTLALKGNLFTNIEDFGLNNKLPLLYLYAQDNPLTGITVHSLSSLPINCTIYFF